MRGEIFVSCRIEKVKEFSRIGKTTLKNWNVFVKVQHVWKRIYLTLDVESLALETDILNQITTHICMGYTKGLT